MQKRACDRVLIPGVEERNLRNHRYNIAKIDSVTQPMQYEALYENGQITWLTEKPPLKYARIMISILEEIPPQPQKGRQPSPLIAGKGKTLGDLVNPLVNDQDWECLK